MATKSMTAKKLLANLRDGAKPLLQCGALTYLHNNAQELEKTSAFSKEEYWEISGILLELTTSLQIKTREEASRTLHAVLKYFKSHNLKFFQAAMQIARIKRHHIFQFLENIEDNALATAGRDPTVVNFVYNCLQKVDTDTMPWLSATACTDNLQMLAQAETRNLSEEEEHEEFIINSALNLVQRLDKVASLDANVQSIHKFTTLLIEKVFILAYMGHKRQRNSAIRVLFQSVAADLGNHMKTSYPDAWIRYKNDLQGPYSTRMTLLVRACESDWASQWSISIQLLGTDLHRGAMLINNLLSVEERAFKSTDTTVRRQAFVCWQLLVDNFALDMKELVTPRRVKLLCVPLIAKNSKTELIALTKLEVWWYLISKLYPQISKFADPVITQFLNFCFGPLGDTPLLSTRVDIVASPGKRFYKTKLAAIDALLQLVVRKQEDRRAFPSGLDERLPHPVSDELFKDCYKAFLHSVGEAVIIIYQLQDIEVTNGEDIIKVLLTNLLRYVRSVSAESKTAVYTELILVVTELLNRSPEVSCVHDFVRDEIIPELSTVAADLIYRDKTLMDLMSKMMVASVLTNVQKKHIDAFGRLLRQAVKPTTQAQYHPETLKFLAATIHSLETVVPDENGFKECHELWFAHAQIAYKFMQADNDIKEGSAAAPSFKTIEAIIRFPFTHMHWANSVDAQNISVHWKVLYKQFESQADLISTVKPNQIVENTSKTIEECLMKNEKSCRTAVYCLEALLSTINYKSLLAQDEIPFIVRLASKLTTLTLHESRPGDAESSLKALSSLLITVYGHSPRKALSYMKLTKKTVELMLKTDAEENLVKEIVGTWETIVSILRGLNTLLDANFLRSYKNTISLALRHVNSDIVSQAQTVLEMENVTEDAKAILVELAQELKKSSAKDVTKIRPEKTTSAAKIAKIAGSFLNRKTSSPRPSLGKAKEKEERKLAPLPPEPDSQDYVVIRSEITVDVNRLTEHQKESLKRRRDDIPALYNDLSQSSSQNTQDLQQWFDGKAKRAETSNARPDAKKEKQAAAVVDKDLNKENKINEMSDSARQEKINEESGSNSNVAVPTISEENSATRVPTPETIGSSGQDPASIFEANPEPMETNVSQTPPAESPPQKSNPSSVLSPLYDHSYVGVLKPSDDSPSEPIAKKLNFESREEYPDDDSKDTDDGSKSGSTTAAKGNRARRASKNAATAESEGKIDSELSRNIRGRGPGRPRNPRTNSNVPVPERGTKRKAASDSESDSCEREKRSKHEISRLRIDMKFDRTLPSKRRSKTNDDAANNESLSRKNPSPEGRGSRTKTGETRTGENLRRSHRGVEKEGSSDPDAANKRRRRCKSETEATDDTQQEDETSQLKPVKISTRNKSRKSLQESGPASESQIIVDDEETLEDFVVPNAETEKIANTATNGSAANSVPAAGSPAPDISEHPVGNIVEVDNDLDEIVESSQVIPALAIIPEKPIVTLAQLNTTSDIAKSMESTIGPLDKKHPRASSPLIPAENLEETRNKTAIEEKTVHDDSDETFLDISAIRPQLAEDVPANDAEEQKAPEESKTNASAAPVKATEPSFNLSSPRNTSKRYAKPRGFAPQGRAAHMLGLVTKQAVLEKDGLVEKSQDEESFTSRKNKCRDNDNETPVSKRDRSTILKDSERTGSSPGSSPGGSRQEKIFNNMKATDYTASSPGKLFGNLKNDGEKVSPKMDRHDPDFTNQNSDASSGNDHDGSGSSAEDRDELPMLEWSSANPPSLTASPSASILKRDRQIFSEIEAESTTPSKARKRRVSFADPPVSKEMGYASPSQCRPFISRKSCGGIAPRKNRKFNTSRGLLGRKDSPMRIANQSRTLRMIPVEIEKASKDSASISANSNEMDMECERENEMLVKIAEDFEDVMESRTHDNTESAPSHNIQEENVTSPGGTKICGQSEVIADITDEVTLEKAEKSSSIVAPFAIEPQTQDDIFNSSDEKFDSPKRSENQSVDVTTKKSDISTQNSSLESFKLNVTNDSVIDIIANSSREEPNKSDCLEDTLDVKNLTNLTMTEDSPGPMSFESVNAEVGMADTLPVTDSLLVTQESQESTPTVELAQPELLNSTDSIYPSLINCRESIDTIVKSLTNPLWVKNLAKHFESKSLRTIGDLARLTEREIVRIPIKGNSKVDFVIKVLGRFEEKLRASASKASTSIDDTKAVNDLTSSPGKHATMDITEVADIDEFLGEKPKMPNEFATLDTTVALSQIEPIPVDSMCVEDFNPLSRQALRRTSTSNSISSITLEPSTCSLGEELSLSQGSTIVLSQDSCKSGKVSVGTSTNSLSKPLTKSVESQTTLEELLDETDVKLVLHSAVKRSSAETLLAQYKLKMGHMSDAELAAETIRMLSTVGKSTEATLKAACRAYGLGKLLVRLPEIFWTDKQFYSKVFAAYCKKFQLKDCLDAFNFDEVKNEVSKKCSSTDIAEMLSRILKQEDQQDVQPSATELSNLDAMLKRLPMDVMINHTLANEQLIPSSVVLDAALSNNSVDVVTDAIESKYPAISDNIFARKTTHETVISYIQGNSLTKNKLLNLHQAICDQISPEDLLTAYHKAMQRKLKEASTKR